MGAFLEMIGRRLFLLLALLIGLAACGDSADDVRVLRDSLSALTERFGPPGPDLRTAFTPQALAETETAFFAEREGPRPAQAILFRQAIDGDVETWQTLESVMLTLRQGVMIGTRGVGGDLMTAEVTEVLAGIRGDVSQALRVHRRLGGENQLIIESFVCNYSRGPGTTTDPLLGARPALVVVEDCIDSDGQQFENRYWIEAGGVIRQSYQWIGPQVGSVTLVRVKG